MGKRTALAALAFFIVLCLGLWLAGCGGGEKKYIGKYLSEEEVTVGWSFTGKKIEVEKARLTLEIKEDGTWKLSPRIPGESSDGEWKVDKDGITLYEGKSRIPRYIMRMEKNKLIDWKGETFTKQD